MRSTSIAALLTIFLIALAHSQAAPRKHDAAISSGAVRVKALQNQVEKQQIEIDALRLRLGKLQQEFQELTEMIADRDADSSDDDDSTDDTDVTNLRVHSQEPRQKRNAARTVRPRTVVWTY